MATYEERAFLFRCSEKLSTKQSKALVNICDLPADLRDQDAFDVILELKKRGKYNKLEELATILKDINRDDLAKEVTAFAEEKKHALDPNAMFERALQETKQQFHSLTDQMQKLRDAAKEAGKRRIEQIVGELISAWPNEKIDKKLKYISCLLAGEKQAKADRSQSLPCTRRSSSDPTVSYKQSTKRLHTPDSIQGNNKPMPAIILPPTRRELPQEPVHVKSWVPEKISTKPTTAPKPKDSIPAEDEQTAAAVNDSDDNTCGTGTSTDDSGFVDAGQYLKEEPHQERGLTAKPSHKPTTDNIRPPGTAYTCLCKHTMEPVTYYKTASAHVHIHVHRESVQDVTYSNPRDLQDVSNSEPLYVNVYTVTNCSAVDDNEMPH